MKYTHQRQGLMGFLLRRRSKRFSLVDGITYLYLLAGVVVMFGPVLWLIMSSFKSVEALYEFPPTFLPYRQDTVTVEGYANPLPLFDVTLEDGSTRRLAQVSRVGLVARMIDPAQPGSTIEVRVEQREAVRSVAFSLDNYTGAINRFPFVTYLRNTVVVTVAATIVTLR